MSKLAIEHFEKTNRPVRIAVDVSIWQFQTLAGQGGSNPALRTFYYRLLRLLQTAVQPLFVFDGPNKPPFKRGKKTGQHGASVSNLLTKQLLNFFGFPFHIAPGEAEAECALLQREGIVDAVLSEDVDTLMFGCGRTLRNWSSEGSRGNKSPTHVSVYDAKVTKEGKSGLDREGMVLVALMSGGDYITEGIPGCGIKVACEAARAGFGKSLCSISRCDATALDSWRQNLAYEIQTNESKHFRVKHKALKIPHNFPDKDVLGYYTHPVVSSASKIQRLKMEITWDGVVDVQGLRGFVAEAFDWTHKTGIRKFIRGLAPALLVHKLRLRADRRESEYGDLVLTAMNEMELVRIICGTRNHFSTDGMPELRVVYSPVDIVGLDLDAEEDETIDYGRDGLAPTNDDDEIQAYESDDGASRSMSPTKRTASQYDPTQPDKTWIPETIVKVGVPLKAEDYAESLRNPKKAVRPIPTAKRMTTKGGMPKGALDKYVKVSKPTERSIISKAPIKRTVPSQPDLPPVFLAPALERLTPSRSLPTTTLSRNTRLTRLSGRSSPNFAPAELPTTSSKPEAKSKTSRAKASQKSTATTNPWTLAAPFSPQSAPKINKPAMQSMKPRTPPPKSMTYASSSGPPPSRPPISLSRKHLHSPSPPDHPLETEEVSLPSSIRITRGRKNYCTDIQTPTKSRSPSDPPPRKKISPTNDPSKLAQPSILTPSRPVSNSEGLLPSLSPSFPNFSRKDPVVEIGSQDIIDLSSSPLAASPPRSERPAVLASNTTQSNVSSRFTVEERQQSRRKGTKKYIMLRDSLPGTWKAISEDEEKENPHSQNKNKKGKDRGRERWRVSQVEVLDLCDN